MVTHVVRVDISNRGNIWKKVCAYKVPNIRILMEKWYIQKPSPNNSFFSLTDTEVLSVLNI